jgi:Cof subfamily protein (haloacid dehalogenase superfamily)
VPNPPAGLVAGGRLAEWRAPRPEYVALDVDGTLLAGTPLPSPAVLTALRALVAEGVAVGVATGRLPSAVAPLIAAAGLPGPHVAHNGGAVVDGDGTVVRTWPLHPEDVDALLALGRGRDDLLVEVYSAGAYRVGRHDPRSAQHTALLGVGPSGSIGAADDLAGEDAVKAVVLAFSPAAEHDAVALAHRLGLAPGASSAPSVPGIRFVNVTHGTTDKGAGVVAAAATIGVGPDGIAGVGDERNDIPMLAAVGTGIAMGDASDEVRAAAHLVAPRFADDGAAVALAALLGLVRDGR